MEFVVSLLARWFYFVFHLIPNAICKALPNPHGMLSALNLYIFLQALALLMFLFASLLSALSVRISAALIAVGGEDVEGEAAGGLLGPLGTPLRWSVLCLIYTLAVSALLFVGWSLWTITWETYYDFPTVRRMLQGPVKPGPSLLAGRRGGTPAAKDVIAQLAAESLAAAAAASDDESEEEDEDLAMSPGQRRLEHMLLRSRSGSRASDPAAIRRERRRHVVLTAPLVVLTLLHGILLTGERFCESHPALCEGGTSVFISDSRPNRIARLSLFISQIQLLVAFTSFFPRWDRVWAGARRGGLLTLVLGLTLQFMIAPSLIVQGAFFLSGSKPNAILLSLWSVWFLLGSAVVMRPENTIKAGFTFRTIADDAAWQRFSMLFKLTGVLWGIIYLAQQVATAGFLSSQKDLIVIGVVYPLVWCIIWVATYIAVACAHFGRLFWYVFAFVMALCAAAAWLLCALVGRSELLLLVDLVWVSLFGFGYRILRHLALGLQEAEASQSHPSAGRSKTVKFVLAANMQTSHARKVAGETARALWVATGLFCLVLAVCVVLAARQQRHQTDRDSLRWQVATGGAIQIEVPGSTLRLGRQGASLGNSTAEDCMQEDPAFTVLQPGEQPRYAACGYKWHGLDLKDFALLSMAAYHTPTAGNDLTGLLHELLPSKKVAITNAVSGTRKWLELEVETCTAAAAATLPQTVANSPRCRSVTVVAVSGTDTSRVQDILENIRMWTEPVMMEIFSVVFPVVRAWPRETTAMMISGIHRIIRWLALQDDQWHYQEILDHVRSLPADREVVLTGHSLGGGISLVVGALSGRQAVAIQPPGLNHALAKHQEQNDAFGLGRGLHQSSVSLVVEHDPISLFDGHGGLVQTMACDRAGGSALGCHMLESTICSLLRHCGDAEGRFSSCRFELGGEDAKASSAGAAAGNAAGQTSPLDSVRALLGAQLGQTKDVAAPLAVTAAAAGASVLALAVGTSSRGGSSAAHGTTAARAGPDGGEADVKGEDQHLEEEKCSGKPASWPNEVDAPETPVVARAG